MEEDACAVVVEIAEAPCVGFEQLYGAVEALGACVGDAMAAVVEQAL